MLLSNLPSPLGLPHFLQRRLDRVVRAMLEQGGAGGADFTLPRGEPALVPADSLSWRVFKNPVVLFIGGIAAVILELAEPAVRTGVWEHSSFRTDPVRRLRRTGFAAMVTVYAARSVAEAMIGNVVRMHDRVSGRTPAGEAYRANDIDLLSWVQATAGFGFAGAYSRYVQPLDHVELDRLYAEGAEAARLYGALKTPSSDAELDACFDAMRGRLEPSPIVFEFLAIMRTAAALPAVLRPLQPLLARAAVELVPAWIRARLGLDASLGLRGWERALVRQAAQQGERIVLPSSPAVQSCLRLDLAADYLFRR